MKHLLNDTSFVEGLESLLRGFKEEEGIDLNRDLLSEKDLQFMVKLISAESESDCLKVIKSSYSQRCEESFDYKDIKKAIMLTFMLVLPIALHLFAIIPIVFTALFGGILIKKLAANLKFLGKRAFLHNHIEEPKKIVEKILQDTELSDNKRKELLQFEGFKFLLITRLVYLQMKRTDSIKKALKNGSIKKLAAAIGITSFFIFATKHLDLVKHTLEKISVDTYLLEPIEGIVSSITAVISLLSVCYLIYEILSFAFNKLLNSCFNNALSHNRIKQFRSEILANQYIGNTQLFQEKLENMQFQEHLSSDHASFLSSISSNVQSFVRPNGLANHNRLQSNSDNSDFPNSSCAHHNEGVFSDSRSHATTSQRTTTRVKDSHKNTIYV
jgi:hypothetical protein